MKSKFLSVEHEAAPGQILAAAQVVEGGGLGNGLAALQGDGDPGFNGFSGPGRDFQWRGGGGEAAGQVGEFNAVGGSGLVFNGGAVASGAKWVTVPV